MGGGGGGISRGTTGLIATGSTAGTQIEQRKSLSEKRLAEFAGEQGSAQVAAIQEEKQIEEKALLEERSRLQAQQESQKLDALRRRIGSARTASTRSPGRRQTILTRRKSAVGKSTFLTGVS